MSATLQRIEGSGLPYGMDDPELVASLLCFHRRSQTLLCHFAGSTQDESCARLMKTYKQDHWGSWNQSKGGYNLPKALKSPPVAVATIESMDVFVLVCSLVSTGGIVLVFLNLEAEEVNRYNISHIAKAGSCADIDQNRKEMVLCSRMKDGGRIQSYSLRCIEPNQSNNKMHYISVFRIQQHMSVEAGRRPVQVVTQDVGGSSLILSEGGGITAIQTGTLEQLWFIGVSSFRFEPQRLWADKFGSTFVVRCLDTGRSNEETLEYWNPPDKFAKAEAGRFERAVLPLENSRFVALTLETISPDMGAFIVYSTANGSVRLWRPAPEGMRADPVLKVDMETSALGTALPLCSDMAFLFNENLPDCPISVLYVRGSGVSRLALHPPNDLSEQNRRSVLELSLLGMQTRKASFTYSQSYGGFAPETVDQFFAAKLEEDELAQAGYGGKTMDEYDYMEQTMGQHFVRAAVPNVLPEEARKATVGENLNLHSRANSAADPGDVGAMGVGDDQSTGSGAVMSTLYEGKGAPDPTLDSGTYPPTAEGAAALLASMGGVIADQTGLKEEQRTNVAVAPDEATSSSARPNTNYLSERVYSEFTAEGSTKLNDEFATPEGQGAAGLGPTASLGIVDTSHYPLTTPPRLQSESAGINNPLTAAQPPLHQHIPASGPVKPKSMSFTPLKFIRGYDVKEDDPKSPDGVGIMRMLMPPGLIMTERGATSPHNSGSQLRTVSEAGLVSISSRKAADQGSMDLGISAIAHRMCAVIVVNKMNQGFLFDARSIVMASQKGFGGEITPEPLRLELDIRQQAKASALMVSDVSITVAEKRRVRGRMETVERTLDGYHSLMFFGDSDGNVNYVVADRLTAICTSSFKAHNAPIVAILSTGDGSLPLWKVRAKEVALGSKAKRLVCTVSAGSAIATVARDGEVKVWQPVFTDMGGVTTQIERVFNVCKLSWRLAGTFACRVPNITTDLLNSRASSRQAHERAPGGDRGDPKQPVLRRGAVTGAVLDPTCVAVVISFSDGSVEHWPLPGLVDTGTGSLTTCKEATVRSRKHSKSVLEMRVYVHLNKVEIKEAEALSESSTEQERLKRNADPIAITVAGSADVKGVAYSYKDLKRLAEASSLVTSSRDYSLVLWRFITSTDANMPNRFLLPRPVRRFVFSGVPLGGLCFSPLDPPQVDTRGSQLSVWRVSAIVSGVLVTAFQGSRPEVFNEDETLISQDLSTAPPLAAITRSEHSLSMLPVAGQVDKASLTAEITSSRLGKDEGNYAWQTLEHWTKRAIPEPTNLTSQQFAVDENVIFDGVMDDVLGTGEAWEPKRDQTHLAKRNVDVEKSEAGIDPDGVTGPDGMKKFVSDNVRMKVHSQKEEVARASTTASSGVRHTVDIAKVMTPLLDPTAAPHSPGYDVHTSTLDGSNVEISGVNSSVLEKMTEKVSLVVPPAHSESPGFNDSVLDEDALSLNSAANSAVSATQAVATEGASGPSSSPNKHPKMLSAKQKYVIQHSETKAAPAVNTHIKSLSWDDEETGDHGDREAEGEPEDGPHKKMTRAMQLRQKKLLETQAREAASTTKKAKTLYVSKKRKDEMPNPNGARQIAGNATTFTVPLNFHKTQHEKAKNKHTVDKGDRKGRKPKERGEIKHEIPRPVERADTVSAILTDTWEDEVDEEEKRDGLGVLTVSLHAPKEDTDVSPDASVNPFYYDRNAKPVYYRNNSRKAPNFIPRSMRKPFVDPSLIPEVDDALSLVGASLMASLDTGKKSGLDCLIEHFTEKDMDNFEKCDQDHKVMVLDEISAHLAAGHDGRGSSKRGLALMKRLQLAAKQRRKAGGAAVLVLADGSTEVDVLLQQEEATDDKATVKLTSPNVGGNAICFAVLMPKGASKEEQEALELPLPPASLLETYKDITEIRHFARHIIAASETPLKAGENEIMLPLTGLKPGRRFKVYCYLRCTATDEESRTFARMTDEEVKETCEFIETEREDVNIGWADLTAEGRDAEIKAAMRCSFVVSAVEADPTIHLITDADLEARDPNTSAGRAAAKKVDMFAKWWAPKDARTDTFALTALRTQFLFYEAMYTAKSMDLAEVVAMGVLEGEAVKSLKAKCTKILADGPENIRSIEGTALEGDEDFFNFRSWLRGGQLLIDYEEDQWYSSRTLSEQKVGGGEGLDGLAPILAADGAQITVPAALPEMEGTAPLPGSSSAYEAFSDGETPRQEDKGKEEEETKPAVEVEEFTAKMPATRLENRATHLLKCCALNVDSPSSKVISLIETFKIADKNNIGESDLTLRRAKLSEDDIAIIMASLKLTELAIARGLTTKGKRIDPSLLGRGVWSAQNICACDVFGPIDESKLEPDNPPALQITCLPGTNRRPIRAWQLANSEEQNLELVIACMLDVVLEAAIEEGVAVPDPEDVDIDVKVNAIRFNRWQAFAKWYAGGEGEEKVPGLGVPSLARVLVAETWEREVVLQDFSILEAMVSLKLAFSEDAQEYFDLRRKKTNEFLLAGMEHPDRAEGNNKSFPDPPRAVRDEIMVTYEQSLNLGAGLAIRLDMLRFYADTLLKGRSEEMLAILWPPGPAKISYQYLFPRLGVIVPSIEMPKARIRLFPSRRKESYTHDTILKWYSDKELDEDDEIMREEELEGQRRRAYLEWLAQEGTRMKQNRVDMLREDKEGLIRREYFQNLEEKFAEIEDLQPNFSKKEMEFGVDLPGRYDKTFTDRSVIYEHGTGADNEDELEDIRQAQAEAAAEEQRREDERKRQYERELKRRQEEAANKARQEEMDRRLAEGVERRRQLREHIENLKVKRKAAADEASRAARDKEHHDKLDKERAELDRQRTLRDQRRARQLEEDREQMIYEDMRKHDFDVSEAETKLMEHEDIYSLMCERNIERKAEEDQEKLKFLQEIYTEHQPYKFNKTRLRLPMLHSLLGEDEEYEQEQYLQNMGGNSLARSTSLIDFYGSNSQEGAGGTHALSMSLDMGQHSMDMGSEILPLDSPGPRSLTYSEEYGSEDKEALGSLHVDHSYVHFWATAVGKNNHHGDGALRAHLLKTLERRTSYTPDGRSKASSRARREKTRQLRASDQKPVLWKGLDREAIEALAAAKERHERATRPSTTGVVLRPIQPAEYTIKDRDERVADNKAAAVARRPKSEGDAMRPLDGSPSKKQAHFADDSETAAQAHLSASMQRYEEGLPESMDFEASGREVRPGGDLDASTVKLRPSEEVLRVGMPTISTQQPPTETSTKDAIGMGPEGAIKPAKTHFINVPEARKETETGAAKSTALELSISAAVDGTLSRSMELASIAMQKSRLEMNSLKSLTLASLSANDNYDHGVRKVKPKNPTEVRALPTETIKTIKKNRSNVGEYVSSGAIMHDKYYLEAVKPGLRDKSSLDESVRQFMQELQKSPIRVLGQDVEGFVSPEKKGEAAARKSKKKKKSAQTEEGGLAELTHGERQLARLKMAVKKNLKGKPNDPERFEGRNSRFRSGVPENPKGFGVLGGTIDLERNGLDPRKTGQHKKSKAAQAEKELSVGVDESKAELDESALNLNSHLDITADTGQQGSPLRGDSTLLDIEPSLGADVDDDTTGKSECTAETQNTRGSTPVVFVKTKSSRGKQIVKPREAELSLPNE